MAVVAHAGVGSNNDAKRLRRALVIELNALTRWCISTYLTPWFQVETTDSPDAANRVLAQHGVEAIIISDELPQQSTEAIERRARAENPAVKVVRTSTDPQQRVRPGVPTCRLEKPFELAKLARLLDVPEEEIQRQETTGRVRRPLG